MSGLRLWNSGFILPSAVNLLATMTFYVLMTTMAGYAAAEFGAGQALAGLASSAFIIGAVLARVITGKYLDFIGRKVSVLLTLGAFVVLAFAYIPVTDIWVLILVRFIHGMAFGMNNTALAAVAQTMIPPARRAEGTGYFGMMTSISMATGPFAAVFLADAYGMLWVFLMCAFFSILAAALALPIKISEREPTPEEVLLKWRPSLNSIIDYRALPLATVMLFAGVVFSVVLSFLDSYSRTLGFGAAASWFYVTMAVSTFVARLFVGRIQDRRGDNIILYPVFGLLVLSFALIAAATGSWMIIAAAVPLGFGFGSLMPAAQAIVVRQSPTHRVGLAVATFFILLDVGTGLGPFLLGGFANALGPRSMYWSSVAMTLCGALIYHFLHGRRQRSS